MERDEREIRHDLENAEQEKLALQKLAIRAADQIDDLAEADCSEPAIAKAKTQADRLRKAVEEMSS